VQYTHTVSKHPLGTTNTKRAPLYTVNKKCWLAASAAAIYLSASPHTIWLQLGSLCCSQTSYLHHSLPQLTMLLANRAVWCPGLHSAHTCMLYLRCNAACKQVNMACQQVSMLAMSDGQQVSRSACLQCPGNLEYAKLITKFQHHYYSYHQHLVADWLLPAW
jgi:hypothetical protein